MAARTGHPYHMYEAMQAQPAAVAEVLSGARAALEALAALVSVRGCLFLVGSGTSLHAAKVAEYWLRGGPQVTVAMPALDFALYPPCLTPQDTVLVVSHRGAGTYSRAALRLARAAGCRTALVTGRGGAAGPDTADVLVETVAQEVSSAHTVSYVAALAALAQLVLQVARRQGWTPPFAPADLAEGVPAALRAALGLEREVGAWAAAHAPGGRVWIAGGGPGGVTAEETALKCAETSYVPAVGMPVETLLHGPLRAAQPGDLGVLFALAGPARERLVGLARQLGVLGLPYLAVADGPEGTGPVAGEATVLRLPGPVLPEALMPFPSVVVGQLLAYHWALLRGTNPDTFRMEDPRFAAASRMLEL